MAKTKQFDFEGVTTKMMGARNLLESVAESINSEIAQIRSGGAETVTNHLMNKRSTDALASLSSKAEKNGKEAANLLKEALLQIQEAEK